MIHKKGKLILIFHVEELVFLIKMPIIKIMNRRLGQWAV